METERIALNQRERDRLKVLHEVKQEHLTQVEAARRLKLSDPPGAADADPHWRARRWSDQQCPEPEPRAASPSGLRPPGLPAHRVSKPQKKAPPNHPWRTFQYGRKPDISTLR
jgi:hypothetical protein